MYFYDDYGWLTANPNPERSTSVEPPEHSDAPIVGQPWPNFTGIEWAEAIYSSPPVPQTQYAFDLTMTANSLIAAVNTPVNVTATLYVHGTQNIAPVTTDFHVPILDANGAVAGIQLVSFTNGVATLSLTFANSSYYSINQESLNMNLPFGEQIYFPTDFKVTIYKS